jgi:CheY-like chemotaxis protein
MNAINMPHLNLPIPQGMQQHTLSILVVDDNPMVREATAGLLSGAGHWVTEAEDGIAALEHLEQQEHFDLVIADIGMPRMNGLSLSKAVADSWPDVPVLLVSGRPQPPGEYTVMMKPFTAKSLLDVIAATVDMAKPVLTRDFEIPPDHATS